MNKARVVKPGDTIGVVATGSPLHPDRFALGRSELERRGFHLKVPLHPGEYYGKYDHGFTNGSPAERAAGLMSLLIDDSVSAILTARGGYGVLDILPLLDYEILAASKKLIIGMSDVTALLVQSVTQAKIPAIHGPGIGTSFADYTTDPAARKSVDALLNVLSDPSYRFTATTEVLREGEGEGPILAGNLSMFTALLGTPYDADYRGAVLVLEDVGEAPFHVHRALTQLKLAGKLDSLAALVFGRFSRCEAKHGPTVDEVITTSVHAMFAGSTYPLVRGLEFGHWGENQPLPLGCRARVRGNQFSLLESPVMS